VSCGEGIQVLHPLAIKIIGLVLCGHSKLCVSQGDDELPFINFDPKFLESTNGYVQPGVASVSVVVFTDFISDKLHSKTILP
jgi:hypothetical protein